MAFENEDEVKDWGEKVLNPKWEEKTDEDNLKTDRGRCIERRKEEDR